MGVDAKKGVSCINIFAMFLIFLMGGLAGNGTVLQTVFLLGSAESQDDETVSEANETIYHISWIEFYYILASVISAPIIGYFYEMSTRVLVLTLALNLLAVCLVI